MTEQEIWGERPEPSEAVACWVADHVPMGSDISEFARLAVDAPVEVREYVASHVAWLETLERESVKWPVHRDPYSTRVRFFGGKWLSGWAGADYRDGDQMVSHSYLGAMNAMVRRGATDEEMRTMAARIYAHEAQLEALRREMADDLRKAVEGA